ncbi:zinc finger protein 236-like isoform X2 [Cylas formicarius]|uniref:zinc finger protein 236-like isoform X2 n=1 Tax=Cylas formicarius TaxID=197179 RepID=UPI0029586113|nr:zinc finger protein 236-like isoform X2 [Cylas formicarius]
MLGRKMLEGNSKSNNKTFQKSSPENLDNSYFVAPVVLENEQPDVPLILQNYIIKQIDEGVVEFIVSNSKEENLIECERNKFQSDKTLVEDSDKKQINILCSSNLPHNGIESVIKHTPKMITDINEEYSNPYYLKIPEGGNIFKMRCSICKQMFNNLATFRNHMASHKASKTFSCLKCALGFNIENNLKVHMVTLHNAYRDICPICKLKFHRMASLKSHILIHQVEELLVCEECDAEFESDEELMKHMENHARKKVAQSKDKDLVCSYCKLEFKTLTEYKTHISLHLEVRRNILRGKKSRKRRSSKKGPYSCKMCGKIFAKNCLLLRHERIHTGEKPFLCPFCSKGFSQKGTLQIHMRHHTGVKQFSCTLCTAKFYQKGNLRAHIEKTHTAPKNNQKMYKCSQCTCIFKKIATLNGHVTKVHVNQVTNEYNAEDDILTQVMNNLKVLESQRCSPNAGISETVKENNEDNELKEDLGVVKVSESHASGSLRRYLVKQMKVGDVRWYFCNYCPKRFKKPSDVIRHIRIHTQEKPFKCSKCSVSFGLKSTLLTHAKTHAKVLICPYNSCDSSFKSTKAFNAHVRAHEKADTPNFRCVLCNEYLWTMDECKSHRKLHKNEILGGYNIIEPCLQQPLFQTAYGSLTVKPPKPKIPNSGLESSEERPHSCNICDAKFARHLSLKRHLQYHNGEKKFKCNLCSKAFLTNYRLKEHLNYHKNIRNYQCQICSKKFVTSSLLKRHLIVHNTFKPYSCPYCKKDFKTLLLCRMHIRQVHKLEETPVIQMTGNTYSSESEQVMKEVPDDFNNIGNGNELISQQEATLLNEKVHDPGHVNYQTVYLNLADVGIPTDGNIAGNNMFSTLKLQEDPLLFNSINDMQESNILFNGDKPSDTVDPNIVIKATVPTDKTDDTEELCVKNHSGIERTNLDKLISNFSSNFPTPIEETEAPVETNDIFRDAQVMCIHCHKVCPNMDDFQRHTCSKEVKMAVTNWSEPMLSKIPKKLEENVNQDTTLSKCNFCNEMFANESQYKKHVISIHGDGKICRYCLKEFQKPSDLKRHLRTHTGERPYGCILCEKKFSLKSTLDTHMKTHDTVQKNIVCGVCNSAFSSKSSLKVHMLLHTGERPYSCSFCKQTFRTATIRKAHENVNHLNRKSPHASKRKHATQLLKAVAEEVISNVESEPGINTEPQPTIQETSPNIVASETLGLDPLILLQQLHQPHLILTDMNEAVPINLNDVTFVDYKLLGADGTAITFEQNETIDSSLFQDNQQKSVASVQKKVNLRKKETQKVECNICHKLYASKDVLRKHKKKVHGQNKKFPCIKCDKGYDNLEELNRHIKLHTGYRPFACQYCPNSFTEEQNLKTHVKRIHQKSMVSQETANALLNLHFDLPVEESSSIL